MPHVNSRRGKKTPASKFRFTPDQAEALRTLLPRELTRTKANRFLAQCKKAVVKAQYFATRPTDVQIRNDIERLANCVREFANAVDCLSALARLRCAQSLFMFPIEAISTKLFDLNQALSFESAVEAIRKKPGDRDQAYQKLLEAARNLHKKLEVTARDFRPRKTHKPAKDAARVLVCDVALAYRDITRKFPPIGRETWFCEFMAALGNTIGVRCGHYLVLDELRLAKAEEYEVPIVSRKSLNLTP